MVATHRHNMLSILTRLIVIDGGKILSDGPRDEVLKHLTASAAAQKAAPAPKEQQS
jgi:ATP-binding cassette subfamily C protein LapB